MGKLDPLLSTNVKVAQLEVKHKCSAISNYVLLFSRIMASGIYVDNRAQTS